MKIKIEIFDDLVCFTPPITFLPARRRVRVVNRAVNRDPGLMGCNPRRKISKAVRID
jgi:hypothetical protein